MANAKHERAVKEIDMLIMMNDDKDIPVLGGIILNKALDILCAHFDGIEVERMVEHAFREALSRHPRPYGNMGDKWTTS